MVALICIILINSKTSHFTCVASLYFPRHGLSVQSLNYSAESGCCSYVLPKPPPSLGSTLPITGRFSLSHCFPYSFWKFSFRNVFLCFNSFHLILIFNGHICKYSSAADKIVLLFLVGFTGLGGLEGGLFIKVACVLLELLIKVSIWTSLTFGCALWEVDGSVLGFTLWSLSCKNGYFLSISVTHLLHPNSSYLPRMTLTLRP